MGFVPKALDRATDQALVRATHRASADMARAVRLKDPDAEREARRRMAEAKAARLRAEADAILAAAGIEEGK